MSPWCIAVLIIVTKERKIYIKEFKCATATCILFQREFFHRQKNTAKVSHSSCVSKGGKFIAKIVSQSDSVLYGNFFSPSHIAQREEETKKICYKTLVVEMFRSVLPYRHFSCSVGLV